MNLADPPRDREEHEVARSSDGRQHGDQAEGTRLLARVLRESLSDALPVDFARRVTTRAAALPTQPIARESRFELVLTLALGLALIVTAGTVMAIHGSAWLPPFHAILPTSQTTTNGWLPTPAGGLGASWLLGQWQTREPL